MSNAQLETAIEAAWDTRDQITSATTGEVREAIEDTLNALDSGKLVALFSPDPYFTNQSLNGFVSRLVESTDRMTALAPGAFDDLGRSTEGKTQTRLLDLTQVRAG